MSEQPAELTAKDLAMLIAPEIDRLRLGIADGVRGRLMAAGIMARIGLSPVGMQLFPMLRNTVPDRAVGLEALRSCERYIPQPTYEVALSELAAAELVEVAGSTVRLTPRGLEFTVELNDALIDVVTGLWGTGVAVAGLEQLAQRAVVAAAATGGSSFSVMAPPYDPSASTSGSRLAERLTSLRFHRADAHAAAWTAAGLTVEQAQDLADGPSRDAIEAETNRRAAGPYEALDPRERSDFLHGLRNLPHALR